MTYWLVRVLPFAVWFAVWIFVGRYSVRSEKRKLNDFAWIMCGIPGTLIMWWVISLTLKL